MDTEKQEINDSQPESLYTPGLELSDELILSVELAPRGEETTYGATPYDRLISLASQKEVLSDRQRLVTNIPDNFPIPVAFFVQQTFNTRFWARLAANDENFHSRLLHHDLLEADPRLHPMIDRGRVGKASPAELMLIRDQLGIRSIEVACLTHPYGETLKEQLPQMQEAIKAGILLLGGEYDENATPRYAVKEVFRDEHGKPVAVLVTQKRDIGTLPSGSDDGAIVRERTSFILRIDDDSQFTKIHNGHGEVEKFANIANYDKITQQEMLEQFNMTIAMLIEYEAFEEVVPVATTAYVFDRETTRMIEALAAEQPELVSESDYFANETTEVEVNESYELLNEITKAYQKEVYDSVRPDLRHIE